LELEGDSLACTGCRATYDIVGDHPVFAPPCDSRGIVKPLVYDLAQRILGGRRSVSRIRMQLAAITPMSVLDVGGGTGFYATAVPTGSRYVVADVDPAKLARLRRRLPSAEALLADAVELPIRDDAFDTALFVAVAHHLSDSDLDRALAELARVSRERVLFLDPVASRRRPARALWRLDRGSAPRSVSDLTSRAEQRFRLEHVETYRILHEYVLWVGSPIP
jgi:ubiquinone/menaquinone biosynthesis C-methylase UbiE